jgi:hypothetical protein
MPWLRGNLHCHSRRSDGDSEPGEVAGFYRQAGYGFVAITDHNQVTAAEHCGAVGDSFVVLAGSEFSSMGGGRHCHVNGIGVTSPLVPRRAFDAAVPALREGVDQARAQGAFAILNHPNWHWAYGAEEIAQAGADAFELWNGGPTCNNAGAAGRASTEAMWDAVLTGGVRIWGVATDDCHRFQHPRRPEWDPPFTGWVAVDSERVETAAILAALRAGRFYASSGVVLEEAVVARSGIRIAAAPWDQTVFWTTFIGAGGRVLARQEGPTASYVPRGDEGYVRARIDCATGARAWTQPLFLDS